MRNRTPQIRVRSSSAAAAAAALVMLVAGCAQTPAPLERAQTLQTVATVEGIEPANRMVTLKTSEGSSLIVHVGQNVRNLSQVKVGDRVVVNYEEALLAEVVKPGTGTVGATSVVARAAPGERPGGVVAEAVRVPVKIYDVDPAQNVVEFTGPRGYNRRIKVNDPKARQFIRGLKPGDEVEVTFREAMAISVEPAK